MGSRSAMDRHGYSRQSAGLILAATLIVIGTTTYLVTAATAASTARPPAYASTHGPATGTALRPRLDSDTSVKHSNPISTPASANTGDPNNTTDVISSGGSQTRITVNGQQATVPANGSYSRTIRTDDESTSINVKSYHDDAGSDNGTSSNNSTLNVNISADSRSGP